MLISSGEICFYDLSLLVSNIATPTNKTIIKIINIKSLIVFFFELIYIILRKTLEGI